MKKLKLEFVRWVHIIIYLNTPNYKIKNAHRMHRDIDITYSHLSKLLKLFKEKGIINLPKKGRETLPSLTTKGKQIGEHLIKIKNLLS